MNNTYKIIGSIIGTIIVCLGCFVATNGNGFIEVMTSTNALTLIAVRTYMTTNVENYVDTGIIFRTLMTVLFKN